MSKLNIEPISQNDPRWKDKKLGTSALTIGQAGCALDCVSMLCTYFGHPILPDALNDWLTNNSGYANRNLLKWETITNLYPDIVWKERIDCPDTPAPLERIDELLNNRIPVIALVDYNPNTKEIEQHFVLIVGKDVNDYFIADPMCQPGDGVYYLSAKYGQPAKAICGLRIYTGNPPQEPSGGTTEPYSDIPERVTKIEIGLDKVNDELAKNTRRLDEIQRSVDVVSADRAILEDIQAKLTELKETVRLNSDTLANTKKELRDEIRTNLELSEQNTKELTARIEALEKGYSLNESKFGFIKKLFGKYFIIKLK